jgi:hypothetical protein
VRDHATRSSLQVSYVAVVRPLCQVLGSPLTGSHLATGSMANHVCVLRFLRLSPPRERREERSDEAERVPTHMLCWIPPSVFVGEWRR